MNILWFSWKDESHPQAGGAEVLSSNIRRRLVSDGHTVKLVTAHYGGASTRQVVEGVDVYRTGGRFGVYWRGFRLFRTHLRTWPDLVIDEMNTIPFGCAFYTKIPTVLLTYQLARQVWFYQMVFPFSLIGYCLEPVYLFMLSKKYGHVLTESESTRRDLMRFGFDGSAVHLFRAGSLLKPLVSLKSKQKRYQVLSLGAVRPMKRTLHIVKAFEYARDINSNINLVVAGSTSGRYARKVIAYSKNSRHAQAITVLGRVAPDQKLRLMRESALIAVTSIKEGWGLIVTEAASQGTPAVAYDVDGLRDSIRHGKTGLLVRSGDVRALGGAINKLMKQADTYDGFRQAAWRWSKQFTLENSYEDFIAKIDCKRQNTSVNDQIVD